VVVDDVAAQPGFGDQLGDGQFPGRRSERGGGYRDLTRNRQRDEIRGATLTLHFCVTGTFVRLATFEPEYGSSDDNHGS